MRTRKAAGYLALLVAPAPLTSTLRSLHESRRSATTRAYLNRSDVRTRALRRTESVVHATLQPVEFCRISTAKLTLGIV